MIAGSRLASVNVYALSVVEGVWDGHRETGTATAPPSKRLGEEELSSPMPHKPKRARELAPLLV